MQSSDIGESVIPNRTVPQDTVWLIIAGQAVLFLVWWIWATPAVIPKPLEVTQAIGYLISQGLIQHLYISLMLYLEAVLLASVISLGIAYLAALPALRPLTAGWSKLRFLGLTGLPFFLTLYLHSAHALKLALLTFSISVFTTVSMLDVLDQIPGEKYDLAHTLRMGDWQTLWEVQVLGRADMAFDVIRQNSAIGWMMLGMVEAMFRSEGGIGTILANQDKTFQLSGVAAIQLSILGVGLGQDWLIGALKKLCCPYASMLTKRR